MKISALSKIFAVMVISSLTVTSHASSKGSTRSLVPNVATANKCGNAFGSDSPLLDSCATLYQQCKSGKKKAKGCKAFVRQYEKYVNEYQ